MVIELPSPMYPGSLERLSNFATQLLRVVTDPRTDHLLGRRLGNVDSAAHLPRRLDRNLVVQMATFADRLAKPCFVRLGGHALVLAKAPSLRCEAS